MILSRETEERSWGDDGKIAEKKNLWKSFSPSWGQFYFILYMYYKYRPLGLLFSATLIPLCHFFELLLPLAVAKISPFPWNHDSNKHKK